MLRSGVIVLLLSVRFVGAAEIAGKVTNEQGAPLPYAPVQVRQEESSSPASGVNADSTGVFVIRNVPPGRYLILADYVGHDPWRETIELREPLRRVEIVLRTRPIRGQDIVVTAVRRLEATTAASVSVSLVTDDELEYRGVRSLDQALETLDGLQVFRSHSVATNSVSIRGSSDVLGGGVGNRVLLLVDGRPALNTDSGGQSWSLVPIGAVERVEVVKGAFSALYGSSAMGGVINLITRDPLGTPETRLVARYGAFEKPPAWMQYRSGLADFAETSVLHADHRGSTGYVVYAAHNRS
ncbi:MAG TPA: TonB-dependent receptor, partial [Candidatus Latescibacteria bacterium]|nr:TonB-dependent receptor [Candidatus Latescibacterota bacterium]